jgi:hypothetical protein
MSAGYGYPYDLIPELFDYDADPPDDDRGDPRDEQPSACDWCNRPECSGNCADFKVGVGQ